MSVDLNKDVYVMMTTSDYTSIMCISISELDTKIKEYERLLINIDMELCSFILASCPNIQASLTCRTDCSSFLDYLKLKKIIYTGIIQKKDFSRLADLYLKKMKSYLDIQMECGEEMVQRGIKNEATYIKQSIDMKDFYLSIEKTLKFYVQSESVYVSNNEIRAVRI